MEELLSKLSKEIQKPIRITHVTDLGGPCGQPVEEYHVFIPQSWSGTGKTLEEAVSALLALLEQAYPHLKSGI